MTRKLKGFNLNENERLKWLSGELTVTTEKHKRETLLAVLSVVCKFCKF